MVKRITVIVEHIRSSAVSRVFGTGSQASSITTHTPKLPRHVNFIFHRTNLALVYCHCWKGHQTTFASAKNALGDVNLMIGRKHDEDIRTSFTPEKAEKNVVNDFLDGVQQFFGGKCIRNISSWLAVGITPS